MKVYAIRYTNPKFKLTNILEKGYKTLDEAKEAISGIAHDFLAECIESDPAGHVYTIDTDIEVSDARYIIVRTSNCGSFSEDIAEYSLTTISVDL